VERLAGVESPTDAPETQREVQAILEDALDQEGFRTRRTVGRAVGGCLLAVPRERRRARPLQVILGHGDTVWPTGTLESMPIRREDGRLYGPGTFDMKAGLANAVFALRTLRELGLDPPAVPVVFVNSDEEIGSPGSRHLVAMLARRARRVFVLEPSFGPRGLLKTARKGVGGYEIAIRGKAAHAGLDPRSGASAILELGRVIEALHALNDDARGTTVNVGVVSGGTRSNVVAAEARAQVDVRVLTSVDAERIDASIRGLRATVPGVSVSVRADRRVPPMERTARNIHLWRQAAQAAAALGIDLGETAVGGGSDGNTTSLFTATLDGLGAVGDGAHAVDEHVLIDDTVDRCALLTLLLMAPLDEA